MRLAFFIALRFLFRSRGESAVKVFALVTVAGVVMSVSLFLLVDAVLNGFSVRLKAIFTGFDAPASLEAPASAEGRYESELAELASKHPEWGLELERTREFYGLVRYGVDMPYGIKARVVGEGFTERLPEAVNISWLEGYDERSFSDSPDVLLVGAELYRELASSGTATVELIHPFSDLGPSGELEPRVKTLAIAGVIRTGYYDIDRLHVFLPETAVRGFASPALMTSRFLITPKNPDGEGAVKSAWDELHPGEEGRLKTWRERNPALFKAMALEKKVFSALLALLVVISCLNLSAFVRLFAMNRRRAGVVLAVLGLSVRALASVYALIGALLGAVGGTFGVGLALAVTAILGGGVNLPEAYGLARLELVMSPATAGLLLFLAPVVASAVAFLPARAAARGATAEGLRLS